MGFHIISSNDMGSRSINSSELLILILIVDLYILMNSLMFIIIVNILMGCGSIYSAKLFDVY